MVRADRGTAACAAAELGHDVSVAPGSGSNIAGGGASPAAGFWISGFMSVMLSAYFRWTSYSLANVSGRVATARATGPKRFPLAPAAPRGPWTPTDRIDTPLIDRSKSLDCARLKTTPASRAPIATRWPSDFSTMG